MEYILENHNLNIGSMTKLCSVIILCQRLWKNSKH